MLNFLAKEAIARVYVFDALRDGYDYFDEVVGATVLPFLSGCASIALAVVSIVELSYAIGIGVGLLEDDKKNHGDNVVLALVLAVAAVSFAVAVFIKSAISLVTRPLVTAVQGFKSQDINRFYDEDVAERNDVLTGGLTGLAASS